MAQTSQVSLETAKANLHTLSMHSSFSETKAPPPRMVSCH